MKRVTQLGIVRFCVGFILSCGLTACAHKHAPTNTPDRHSAQLNQTDHISTDNLNAPPKPPLALAPVSTHIKDPKDPFEGFNREVFRFNDALDRAAFKPLAKTYNFVVPKGIRTSVTNFFSNIGDAYTMVNNYLQGDFTAGSQDLIRLSMNSLFGVLGLFDIASQAGLPKHQQDFGQTLGHYGIPSGPYLVLPLLGPSTVRDTVGFMADRTADPTTYIQSVHLRNELYALRFLNTRASLLEITSLINRVSLDKYISVRNAYLQRRDYLIRGNKQALPDYGDEDADQDESSTTDNSSHGTEEHIPATHMVPPGPLPILHIR